MADDIRLVIGVEQSGLLKAITNTESLETKVKKLSAAYARDAASYGRYNKAVGDLAKATGRNKKELLSYGRALRADEKATKKATAEVKAFTLARKQATAEDRRRTSEKKIAVKATEDLARAEAKNAASLKSMRMATDSVYRNQQKRLQMKKLLKSAIAAETMTTQQAIVALKKYNTAQMSSTKAMGMAKNRMNGNNMAIQQLGYQFGDFAVQVQGGTSAFVAFSQQGAQLAGMLPMIAGPLGLTVGAAVGLSAALGILIPIGSAVGRMFFEMKGSAKQAAEEAKALDERIKSITDNLREYARVKEAAGLGVSLNFMDLTTQISQAKEAIAVAQALVDADRAIQAASAEESVAQFGREQELKVALEKLAAAKETLAKLEAMEAEQRSKLHDEDMARRSNVVNAIKHEASVQANLFGKTSDEQERSNELREFQNKLIEAGIRPLSYQYLEALKYYHQMVQNREVTASFAQTLEDADEAQKLLSDTSGNYEAQLLLVNAQIKALQEGKNAEVAAFIEGERVKITALYETSRALNTQTGDIIALAEASLIFVEAMGSLDALAAAKAKLSDLKGDLNGGSKEVKEDAFEKLTKELSRRKELLSLSKERAVVTRAIWSLEDSLGKSRAKYSAEEIKALVEKNIALKKTEDALEEAAAQQEQLVDFIGNSMETAMMGIVDGTLSVKDAFKSMAAEIIKELYRVLVVQQMVAAAKAFFGFGGGGGGVTSSPRPPVRPQADGGVFTKVNAYANGGIVSSPTNFPMAGNQVGLMGEAGPEAIMPLKRGSNGKLGVQMEGGGGGDVININQSFNFQANGDETVKKLIAQAAPKIADMAKASVIDSRRRGGSTKAAFG